MSLYNLGLRFIILTEKSDKAINIITLVTIYTSIHMGQVEVYF